MAYHHRLPILKGAQSTHPLCRMRSEGYLKATPEKVLPRLRSMGQLSPPPDEPLPPVPPRSPLRFQNRVRGNVGPPTPSNSSSSSSSRYSQDDEAGSGRYSDRNTMLIREQSDQKNIEFTLHRNSKQTPNLDDLNQILHLRGRLQEMGTTFTAEGEMLTYGNPPLNAELEQMLRLGSMYDQQWNMFFNGGQTQKDANSDLWLDLKVLKKMLQNEGITFDDQHKRLNYGTAHPKLIRMSDQYDVLREEWLDKTMQNIHPAQRQQQYSPTHEELPKTPTNLGWKFLLDDGDENEFVRKKSRRSSRLKVVVEEQPNIHSGPGATVQEDHGLTNIVYPSPPITPDSAASSRRTVAAIASDTVTTARSREFTVGTPIPLHGSSPLQAAETASMLLRDAESETRTASSLSEANEVSQPNEERRPGHFGVLALLVEDERRRADERQRADAQAVGEENRKSRKSKGVRKWLRAVLGRKKDDGH